MTPAVLAVAVSSALSSCPGLLEQINVLKQRQDFQGAETEEILLPFPLALLMLLMTSLVACS